MRPAKVIHKWQFVAHVETPAWLYRTGWRFVCLGIFRIHTMPPEGVALSKCHYKGFYLRFRMWVPFEKDKY